MKNNPAIYFEIPVKDLDRAEVFYNKVFGYRFEREMIDGYEMAFFPFNEKAGGITGALAKGDVYQPSKTGTILYFTTDDIEETLQKVLLHKGTILYPITHNEAYHFLVAEFEDCEGNRIGLQQLLPK